MQLAPESSDFLKWDVANWQIPLDFWATVIPSKDRRGTALEIGAGSGGLSLWSALQGYDVVCSDIENDFETAKELHRKFSVSEKISYLNLDCLELDIEEQFDMIIFKSVLGAIGRIDGIKSQREAVYRIRQALRPGGILLFAENLQASWLHRVSRKLFVPWGSSWLYLGFDELGSKFNCFSASEVRSTGFLATFGRTENQRRLLAHFDLLLFNKIMPETAKYIGYGWAKK